MDGSNFIFSMCDRRTTYYCVKNLPSPFWFFIEDLCHFLKVKNYICISKQSLEGFIDDAVWQRVKGAYCAEVRSLKVKIRSQKGPVTRHIDNFMDLRLLLGEDLLSVLSTTKDVYRKDSFDIDNNASDNDDDEEYARFTSINKCIISERAKMLSHNASDYCSDIDLWNDMYQDTIY